MVRGAFACPMADAPVHPTGPTLRLIPTARNVLHGRRFTFKSDRRADIAGLLKGATTGLMHRSKLSFYSINSVASACTTGGIVRPRAFAVLRLMTSANSVGCRT